MYSMCTYTRGLQHLSPNIQDFYGPIPPQKEPDVSWFETRMKFMTKQLIIFKNQRAIRLRDNHLKDKEA